MLPSGPGTLFKHYKFNNYSRKKSTIIISNALNTYIFIKNLQFKMFKECPRKYHVSLAIMSISCFFCLFHTVRRLAFSNKKYSFFCVIIIAYIYFVQNKLDGLGKEKKLSIFYFNCGYKVPSQQFNLKWNEKYNNTFWIYIK